MTEAVTSESLTIKIDESVSILVTLHFDKSCGVCNKSTMVEIFKKELTKALSPQQSSENKKAIIKKLNGKKPYSIYVDCNNGCELNAQSFFDTPEHIDGTYTLINLGPMKIG